MCVPASLSGTFAQCVIVCLRLCMFGCSIEIHHLWGPSAGFPATSGDVGLEVHASECKSDTSKCATKCDLHNERSRGVCV